MMQLVRLRWRTSAPAVLPAAPAPRPGRRVSRRVVLWGLGSAAAAHLGLSAALETACPHWRDVEYGHRLGQVRGWGHTRPDRPLVFLLGSSRVQFGISPADMPTGDHPGAPLVYNFGLTAAPPVRVRAAFERLLADGVRPAAVVLEVFPATLGWGEPAEHHLLPIAPQLTAGDLRRAATYCESTAELGRRWAAHRLTPWHSARSNLMNHWAADWVPWPERTDGHWTGCDPHGWRPYPADDITPETRAEWQKRARAAYAPALGAGRVCPPQAVALRAVLRECRRAGIRAALLLTPEGPEFRSWYSAGTTAAVSAFVDELRTEFAAPVFAAPADLPETDFADSHHLLRAAARRYSRRLWADGLREWLA